MAVRPNCSTPRKSRAKTHVADLMSSWVRLVKRCTVHIARPGGRGARSNWTRAPPAYSRVTDVHFAIPHSHSLFSTCLDITGPSREPIHKLLFVTWAFVLHGVA